MQTNDNTTSLALELEMLKKYKDLQEQLLFQAYLAKKVKEYFDNTDF